MRVYLEDRDPIWRSELTSTSKWGDVCPEGTSEAPVEGIAMRASSARTIPLASSRLASSILASILSSSQCLRIR